MGWGGARVARHTPRRTSDDGVECRVNAVVRCAGVTRGRLRLPSRRTTYHVSWLTARCAAETVSVFCERCWGVGSQQPWGRHPSTIPRRGDRASERSGTTDPPDDEAKLRPLLRTGTWERSLGVSSGPRRARKAVAGAVNRTRAIWGEARLVSVPARCPRLRCGPGRAALDPSCRIPQRGRGSSLLGTPSGEQRSILLVVPGQGAGPSILRCERWQSEQRVQCAVAGWPLATVPGPRRPGCFPGWA